MLAKKLSAGDTIRIIAPSFSGNLVSKNSLRLAEKRLNSLGLKVTFGKNAFEEGPFGSAPLKNRLHDFHEAFRDPEIKAILSFCGGYSANQLILGIDYNLVIKSPKIFCGGSDSTVLQNVLYKKTGLITYYGPDFEDFGLVDTNDSYLLNSFEAALMQEGAYSCLPSKHLKEEVWPLQEGRAEGIILGGNLSSLLALVGTPFMPSFRNAILFIDERKEVSKALFERHFETLTQQLEFKFVEAILIGRFSKESEITHDLLKNLIESKSELKSIPVAANLDFGGCLPIFTFPIGGACQVVINKTKAHISLYPH
ncbi:S66 family peptidase [Criblamydia sequanensis]|uniref:Carboxypeptidase n=1 Tax=Candidatus Criblamydia sequanensis CRIB-18 TaxID=1437425 RepID=A0A090DVW4_9BACT|nr:S66 peptidase family protein [Criblamydia sequanensis]CDR33089.1 putative carboxypeptidase [Criblamydia sequanensis CRIB-18]